MQAAYTPPRRTTMTLTEALSLARWALKFVLGREPSDEIVSLFLAKVALETGRFTAIWNGNWGNWKATEQWEDMFTCILLNEVLKRNGRDTLVWFAPEGELSGNPAKGGKLIEAPIAVPNGHPQTRMRAFANNVNGVEVYVESLERGRYREAWSYLLLGDAVAYVHSLKAHGYFTADEGAYRRGVVSIRDEYLARIRNEAPPVAVDLGWEALKLSVPGLQFDLADLIDTPLGADFAEVVA
jgi:hypothetical protein